jgi:hypothetical protein
MPIRKYLDGNSAFEPEDIKAMSDALELACGALRINGHVHGREIIATRIIDLARTGVIDAQALSDRVVAETNAMRLL